MEEKEEYVGSKIFDKIQTDERVTKDLAHCLYCKVTSYSDEGNARATSYNIPLDCIRGADFKQCPACKRIYILKDPF